MMPFFMFKSKPKENQPQSNTAAKKEPSSSEPTGKSATNTTKLNKETSVRFSDLLSGRSFDSEQKETVSSSTSSEPSSPSPPPPPQMTFFQRMKSFVKKAKNSTKKVEEEKTEYDNTHPLVLEKCKSSSGVKCCNPKITGMSRQHLLQYIEHWERSCTKQSPTKEKGATFNSKHDVKEIYTEEVINIILRDTDFKDLMGIINSRHDCFGIVVMQALMTCTPFVEFVARKTVTNSLDKLIRNFVGQYVAQSKHIGVSPILREVFPEAKKDEEEDAEKFWEVIASEYLSEDIAKIETTYTYTCDCGFTSVKNAKDNCLMLSWPDNNRSGNEPTKVLEMVKQSAKQVTVEKECSICNRMFCTLTTTHNFADIFVINVSPYYYSQIDSKRLFGGDGSQRILRSSPVIFHSRENFTCLTTSKTPVIYKLKAIVYYQQSSKESGHYWARLSHKETSYYADDYLVYPVKTAIEKPKGRPYFAFYTRTTATAEEIKTLNCDSTSEDLDNNEIIFDGTQPGPSTRF